MKNYKEFFKNCLIFIAVIAGIVIVGWTILMVFASTHRAAKPVIYLYPEETAEASVTLEGVDFGTTYPKYNGGWTVTAQPDGTLTDHEGREYSYLFWDGDIEISPDFSKGFCVPGEDTEEFLQKTLSEMGLTPKEYNEFIVYWLPLMEKNDYNLISFQGENYGEAARLTVSPEPDSVLRVFMAWKVIKKPIDIEPQSFEPFERNGFTVVEWGGMKVK